ncbi:hypothetical protein ABL78_7539 [Leptomonas seymouri]|uniref:Uncharacterized protein n=1 Tax=Leptomonas seymouri TaxID=5684 RepID=A0A0N1PCB0_LEPSE|nr:hypothetical protein ABL78_7539 [Leptomonas seymouri]|eukprot:KPI83422.1 hypothetical protein ABL78_7539 [Leptomonas seymouri]
MTSSDASSAVVAPHAPRSLPRPSASHPNLSRRTSSQCDSPTRDKASMGAAVPRRHAARARSGVSNSNGSSTSPLSPHTLEQLQPQQRGDVLGKAHKAPARRQQTPTTPTETSARDSEEDSCVPPRRSTTTATTTTATDAAAAANQPRRSAPTPSSLPSPSPYHSEADVARVRAALAEAGYPNPSWQDIEHVFEQVALTSSTANARAESNGHPSGSHTREGETAHADVDVVGYSHPSPSQQPRPTAPLAHDKSSLLHYLEPSLRLERYIQLRERELESMCLRPTAAATPSGTSQRSAEYERARAHAAAPRASAPAEQASDLHPPPRALPKKPADRPRHPHPSHSAVAAMAAQHRRAANIVFNITGDQRFRFFPSTRTPQGSGVLLCSSSRAATAAHTAASAATTAASGSGGRDGDDPTRQGDAPTSASSISARLTPYNNFYNPERVAHGGGGGSWHMHSAAKTKWSPPVLSGNCVSYLDPQGCTLRRKADPVKRGQQMRMLWDRDNFLSQRRRPQEAWRTRQITMSNGQAAMGE